MKEILYTINPFKDKLYRYALRIVGDVMEAEDVVQELLIKLWKKKEYFKTIDNKEAWCMTLTRNMSIDKTRKRKFRTNDISEFHFIKDAGRSPYEQVQSRDNLGRLESIIEGLSEKHKTVIQLRDIEGYSYKEISSITGYTTDQVKVYLHRARHHLKKKINRKEYE